MQGSVRKSEAARGVKFSYRQIAASAAGAVLSAVIASIFGVKGTIVGVAIGSIAATTGTALVFQSIERTNKAVKQVVVHVPDNALLRRLGGTKTSGVTSAEPSPGSAVHEETATSARNGQCGSTGGDGRTADTSRPSLGVAPRTTLPWPQIVGVVVVVFVVSLLFVTVVELIAGRPLADLFGHCGRGHHRREDLRDPGNDVAATDDDHHHHDLVVNDDDLAVVDHHHRPSGAPRRRSAQRIDHDHLLADERLGQRRRRRRLLELSYQPLNAEGRSLEETGEALLGVQRVGDEFLRHRFVLERRRPVDVERSIGQPFGDADGLGRSVGQPGGQLLEGVLEFGPGDDSIDQTQPICLGGRDVVTEEEQLLGLLDTHQAGEQPRAAAVGGDAAPDEDLDELRLLGRHHQIACQCQVHAAACRRSVDPGDDRLFAVEDGAHEPLPTIANGPRPVAHDRVGRPLGSRVRGAAPARRSAPVQKALSPAPVMTTTRTSRSADASWTHSPIWSRMALVIAFPASGRLSVIRATPSSICRSTSSPAGVSVVLGMGAPHRRSVSTRVRARSVGQTVCNPAHRYGI